MKMQNQDSSKTTYSPVTLKNVMIIPGIVCPNKTTMKLENEITANSVKIYVFQSKILCKVCIPWNYYVFFSFNYFV